MPTRHRLAATALTVAAASAGALQATPSGAVAHGPATPQVAPLLVREGERLEPRPWVAPVADYRLTGRFGASDSLWASSHTGLDFAAPEGAPIRAVAPGLVTDVSYDGSYGYKTVLTLRDGTQLWFCHQSEQHVAVGDRVGAGQVIGLVGSTGNVTGPHLHLEVRPSGGAPVDPQQALAAHGRRV